ncbi:MAG: trimethylamine methyltransferase family protein [Dethiobacteria bacterium]|nr:trimethylamine methyltransferase family protein [Dethiobacteria bacterium]
MIAAYRSNYNQQLSPQLSWFSSSQLEEIHSATIDVLERAGVRVDHDESLKLLKEAGCLVKDRVVKIPGWMIDEAIRVAPSKINIYNREGQPAMSLESNLTYYGTGSDLPFHLDLESGIRRNSVKQDVVNAARVIDHLPNLDFAMSYGIPRDVQADRGDLHQFAALTLNCAKPIIFTAFNEDNLKIIIDMAAAAAGSHEDLRERPYLILYDEPISPLIHTREGMAKMFTCIEYGVPVIYTPGVVAGGTCPVTKAGTIVQMNAESLSGLLIAQLKKKGAQVIIGGGATPMEMNSTATLYGSPDAAMNYCAMSELARFYKLPNFTEAGCSNAPVPDAQAGMEASMGLLLNQLCGANLVHDVGYLDGGKTGSLPFLAMCDDFISAARYIGAGTAINPETIGVDNIVGVGPSGHYLGEEHTMKHFRSEIWMPTIFNRMMYETWEQLGSKDCFDLAREKVKAILEGPVNAPSEAIAAKIASLL